MSPAKSHQNIADEHPMSIARALTWRYVIALALVATLSTAAWFSLHLVITEQESTAAMVNVSGRQRMLSQRTALFANLLITTSAAERNVVRANLTDAIDLMARSHQGLTQGDFEMGLPDSMSPAVHAMYFEGGSPLDSQVINYIKTVRSLLQARDDELTVDNPLLRMVTATAPNELVKSLDQMVQLYQREGEASIKRLARAETIFWLVTLLLLVLEAGLIFHPFSRHIRAVINKLLSVSDELRAHQEGLNELILKRTAELEKSSRGLAESAAIIQSTEDAIIGKSLDGIVTSWNRGAEDMFGYAANEMIGSSMRLLFPPERLDEEDRILERIRRGEVVSHFETVRMRKDGQRVQISATISPIRDHDGNIVGASKIARDISDRKKSEAEIDRHRHHLQEMVEERTAELEIATVNAESASRAKSTFLANMSHEIRTPMNAIIGMTSIALRRAEDPKLRDQLGKISSASLHLLTILNDVLDISKIEADRVTLDLSEFRFGEILENLTSLLAVRAEEKGLNVVIDVLPEVANLPLLGDPARIGQILLNFASNAIKFTDQGAVTVRLRLSEESESDVLLRCEVVDTGIGISSDDQQRLFRAFEQADGSMTRKYGGTGLGLAISKRLVKLMGGDVGVESRLGVGSTFWFVVRLRRSTEAIPHKLSIPANNAEARIKKEFSGTRILLAEDEPINQEVSQGLLEDIGLVIDIANDGQQALELARLNNYALILMDMQMPKLNGMEAARAIRGLPGYQFVPILAMTANVFEDDRKKCFEAGMNDHIGKPIDPDTLFETLLKWLAKSKA